MVVEHVERDVDKKMCTKKVPEAGCEAQACIDVLHHVVVVDLDLQDENASSSLYR